MAKTAQQKMAAEFEKLLTVEQAAKIKRVPARTIRTWCKTGHLPAIISGDEYRIDPKVLAKTERPKRGPKPAA